MNHLSIIMKVSIIAGAGETGFEQSIACSLGTRSLVMPHVGSLMQKRSMCGDKNLLYRFKITGADIEIERLTCQLHLSYKTLAADLHVPYLTGTALEKSKALTLCLTITSQTQR